MGQSGATSGSSILNQAVTRMLLLLQQVQQQGSLALPLRVAS
jgi:hypothetical protein